jgi:L-histidine Nalpha-methyltransferase
MTARTPATSPMNPATAVDDRRNPRPSRGPDPDVAVERHLTAADRTAALADDVRRGLTARPKELPPKWFYDATGSLLFDEITRLPEYYPTRRERAILAAHAPDIAAATAADTLIELGSGTSEKTRLLLDALAATSRLRRFVPFDVDENVLLSAGRAIRAEYPDVSVRAVVGDFERHIRALPGDGRRLVAFLGGTIGNLRPAARKDFLSGLRDQLGPDDHLLLGTDLVKDVDRLVAAYDDSAGVTAAFNRNVLSVINRELGADFDLRGFAHVAAWDETESWIEMRLRAVRDQVVRIPALDLEATFTTGEQMRTEISAKFRRPALESELTASGWTMLHWWTDEDCDFALTLASPV